MRIKRSWLSLALLWALISINTLKADEGMWLPSLLSKINVDKMHQMGMTLTSDDIYNINKSSLKDAIIALDHGSCTGELVSAEGLFLTNHHCGFGDIQSHSTEEHNYLRDGFWAKSKEDELPNPGKTVTFLIRVEDVTERVLAVLNDKMSEKERRDSIQSISQVIQIENEADSLFERKVRSLYASNRFYLFVTQTFRDVRLVGTPPEFLGKFGGDTDNWMWPRHTADFSMFRIYSDSLGNPADYSKNNIPYHPKHFLPISLKGVQKDDFAMVMGYPGSTNRYLSSDGVKQVIDVVNSIRIEVREAKLNIIKDYMKSSDKAFIQYASKYARSSNYYKYSIGQNKGLVRLKVEDKKRAIENEFQAWVNESDARKSKYGEVVNNIKNSYKKIELDKTSNYVSEALLRGTDIISFANKFSSLEKLLEHPKADAENLKTTIKRLKKDNGEFFKDFDVSTDKKVMAALSKIYVQKVSHDNYPKFLKDANKKYHADFEKWTDNIYEKSIFSNKDDLDAFLNNPNLKALKNDPIYQASKQTYKLYYAILDRSDSQKDILATNERLFLAGLMEMHADRQFYPNANSTMRITYGSVKDYSPADAVKYNYFTTLKGYVEKGIAGDFDFDVSTKLIEMYNSKDFGRYVDSDGTLHTCFISNNDITGGNSGSPVLNGKGELIGIAFDGNWEAMSGDIAFEKELQKCISVDIRFVLWVIDKYSGASHLVDEMTIIN